ncbi:MAG TPA: flippase activity-associated protein Agl23 [Ktedonobacterales bacterium]
MSMHSLRPGNRARRKAQQAAQEGAEQEQLRRNDSNGYEANGRDAREESLAAQNGARRDSVSASSVETASSANGVAPRFTFGQSVSASSSAPSSNGAAPSVSNGSTPGSSAEGAAPARLAFVRTGVQEVQTGERSQLPPPPPAPTKTPQTPEEPRETVIGGLVGSVTRRVTGMRDRYQRRAQLTWQFLRTRTIEQWTWVAIVLLAGILRFWGLGDKPLHHDESMHAFYSYLFARDPASYAYDPLLHGPFQFHAVGIFFDVVLFFEWIFRQGSAAGHPWINDFTARVVPALFGIGIVILPAGLRRELGRTTALIAALLLAVSPAFVYFSRFLREDIYFNFFMFAMVVCAVRFARDRETKWLVGLFAAAVLAYATFEGIFLALAIFLGFLAVMFVWEIGQSVAESLPRVLEWRERLFFSRTALLLLLGAIGSALAIAAMSIVHRVGAFATANQSAADAQAQTLEHTTVIVLLWVSILVALFVIGVLFFQMLYDPDFVPEQAEATTATIRAEATPGAEGEDDEYHDAPVRRKKRLAERINDALEAPGRWQERMRDRLDPERQTFLRMLLAVTWVQWFVAFVTAWVLFAALFWVIPGGPGAPAQSLGDGFQLGVGKGIWGGLYYWATQQDVARGGQPWYYYLLLIPLYEQLAIVFGIAGAIYSLVRPTRFRLFLIWWFVGSLALYSWAGEKMPWLSIQILLPLMLLAAIAIDVVLAQARAFVFSADLRNWEQTKGALRKSAVGLFGTLAAVLLLIPMVHSMWVLSQQDAANGPKEMMVYVQTTTDVTTVMNKINAADKTMYGGYHQLRIAVGNQEEWPFYWYLRDYWLDPHPSTYVAFDPSVTDPTVQQPQYDVLILYPSDAQTFMAQHPTGYTSHQYKLRSWWDEAYKPLPGTVGPSDFANTGVGLAAYLSYGSNPPPNAKFDLGRASSRLWNWLWFRQPLGATDGSFDFVLVVRDGVPIQTP